MTAFDVSDVEIAGRDDDRVHAVKGDVRNAADVRAAIEGNDLVVHTAAIHGIHLANHSAQQFYDLNVTGTFNVWQAAAETKVKGVVFSSTMGVYGESRRSASVDEAIRVTEELPLQPGDIYAWTKVVGEELCRYHLRHDGIPSVAMRYGMFVPEPFFRYGIRLLYGGVHELDVAFAVMAAIDALVGGKIRHEAFNVESYLPFAERDRVQLRLDPLAALDHHFPGSRSVLESRGVATLKPITEWYAMDRIAQHLDFRPKHNFADWLAELERRPAERAEKSPPWP